MIEYVPDKYWPYVVYCATNLANGHIYVGATEKGVRQRHIRHLWNAKNGRQGKFYNAIRKYGENSFWFHILATCDDYWDALAEEREFIKALKPEYNLTDGGGGIKGYKFSLEVREKMSKAKKGKKGHPCPQHIKDRMRLLGLSWKGKKITDEARLEQIRLMVKKGNLIRSRPVRCISDGKEFASLTEAGKFYNLTTGQLSTYCKKKFKRRNGLRFEYITKEKPSV